MTDDDVTARLAEALTASGYRPATHAGILAALLPVVRELIAEARAESAIEAQQQYQRGYEDSRAASGGQRDA